MPPKKNINKKITFQDQEIDPRLKQIFPDLSAKQDSKQLQHPSKSKQTKGGAKNKDDSDESEIESDESDSDVDLQENFDEEDEDDALENDDEDDDDDDKSNSGDEDDGEEDDGGDEDGEECMYKFSGKKSSLVDADDEPDDEAFYFEEDDKILQDVFVPENERITRPTLTKYEKVRVLGERSKQLSLNAKPMIKGVEKLDPKEIAKLELKMGVLPMIIIRTLPTGKKERWRVNELKIVN